MCIIYAYLAVYSKLDVERGRDVILSLSLYIYIEEEKKMERERERERERESERDTEGAREAHDIYLTCVDLRMTSGTFCSCVYQSESYP